MPRFVPRQRKHKQVARPTRSISDTNSEVVLPESSTARDARRQALQDEITAAQPESKSSSKKRKRLDKYIETKLRKEEAAELVRQLEKQNFDTSLLQSSKRLGGIHSAQRQKAPITLDEDELEVESSNADLCEVNQLDGDVTEPAWPEPVAGFGSGLKRSLHGSAQPLVIKKRKRRGTAKACRVHSDADEEGEEWHGFSDDQAEARGFEVRDGESQESSASSISSVPDNEETKPDSKPRASAFKVWANDLRNAALDFQPTAPTPTTTTRDKIKESFHLRQPSPDPLLAEIDTYSANLAPTDAVTINRAPEIHAARMELPVVQEEQRIMEAITRHPIVVICGATGSGKTTQIPQMLLENGYGSRISSNSQSSNGVHHVSLQARGMIGITQPRRVAATSVAARVSHELGPIWGKCVAHQVRYDTSVRSETAIKFMTDGILLREIQQDYLLAKYSIVVLDEAHERTINTDILIGMLARIVSLRSQLAAEQPNKCYPLKLVIMSATLSQGVSSFLQNDQLWKPFRGAPPVVVIEGRQFPVTVHFAKNTRRDYVDEVVAKVVRGHRKLPPGGMLVFLTGQQEILEVTKKLKNKLASDDFLDDDGGPEEDIDVSGPAVVFLEEELRDTSPDSDAEIGIEPKQPEDDFAIPQDATHPHSNSATSKPHVLPLYANLQHDQQLRVFQPPPPGHRLIVLSTNVAETSLTIPNIRYIFDTGRAKQRSYNTATGVQTMEVGLISKASAEQRKGRAGRTGPGHVWRLYSSNIYEQMMKEETKPEILRTGLESVVLQLKAMDISHVTSFPFPTPPDMASLQKAEQLLRNLGTTSTTTNAITPVGRNLMRFPVHPRYGIMLLLAQSNNVIAHAIALVAALATGELFVPELAGNNPTKVKNTAAENEDSAKDIDVSEAEAENTARHQAYTRSQATLSKWDKQSDAIKMLIAALAHADPEVNTGSTFCRDFWVREKAMTEIQLLRRQLHSIVHGKISSYTEKLELPKEKEFGLLKQIVAAGFIDQVAIRSDLLPNYTSAFSRKPKKATEVAYRTLLPSLSSIDTPAHYDRLEAWEKEVLRSVFVHPSSVLAKLSVKEMPDYLVYSHLSRAPAAQIGDEKLKRTRFHPLTPVTPKVLAVLAEGTPLLQLGKPIGKIEDLSSGTKDGWGSDKGGFRSPSVKRRQCWISAGLKGAGSEQEWPLAPWKVVQRRLNGKDWEVERVIAR